MDCACSWSREARSAEIQGGWRSGRPRERLLRVGNRLRKLRRCLQLPRRQILQVSRIRVSTFAKKLRGLLNGKFIHIHKARIKTKVNLFALLCISRFGENRKIHSHRNFFFALIICSFCSQLEKRLDLDQRKERSAVSNRRGNRCCRKELFAQINVPRIEPSGLLDRLQKWTNRNVPLLFCYTNRHFVCLLKTVETEFITHFVFIQRCPTADLWLFIESFSLIVKTKRNKVHNRGHWPGDKISDTEIYRWRKINKNCHRQ